MTLEEFKTLSEFEKSKWLRDYEKRKKDGLIDDDTKSEIEQLYFTNRDAYNVLANCLDILDEPVDIPKSTLKLV